MEKQDKVMLGTRDGLSREIKFRVVRNNQVSIQAYSIGNFIDGVELCFNDGGTLPMNDIDWSEDEVKYIQYTGVKDKNGVEIYEGDILYYREPFLGGDNVGKVYFSNGCYYVGKFHKALIHVIGGGVEKTVSGRDTRTTVIGNIFEHPHLLEAQHETTTT